VEVHLKTTKGAPKGAPEGRASGGRRSLKRYEVANLLFFLTIIVVLGILVTFVFHYYGTKDQKIPDDDNQGVISAALSDGSDVGVFYLGTRISEVSLQYQSRLEIPVTDDGLIASLFSLPGVEGITINQSVIMIRKSHDVSWRQIQPGVDRIVNEHLHMHF
jgi:hypothetical protein